MKVLAKDRKGRGYMQWKFASVYAAKIGLIKQSD
jgi:hypothetical protein